MGVHYRRTSDNVGFEVYDTKTSKVLNDELIFSKLEAQKLVAKINLFRRSKKSKTKKSK